MCFCKSCGKSLSKSYGGYCQACYNYFRNGGIENPIPPKGVIAKDSRGYIICHICGKAYKRLGSHVREVHKMTITDYKEEFGLCNNARTTEENYSKCMRNYAYQYNMDKMLKQKGQATRITKGENNLRRNKKARLQECLERSERYTKKNK